MTMEKYGVDKTEGKRCKGCGAQLTPQDKGSFCEECRDEQTKKG